MMEKYKGCCHAACHCYDVSTVDINMSLTHIDANIVYVSTIQIQCT